MTTKGLATSRLKIRRLTGGRAVRLEDTVVTERPVTIFLNDVEIATPMCSPKNLDSLAVGFLFAEGIIGSKKDIEKVLIDKKDGVVWVFTRGANEAPPDLATRRFITTGCGRGLTFVDARKGGKDLGTRSSFSIPAGSIPKLMGDFLRRSQLFMKTGGCHSAALCSRNEILILMEDIGRHSAIDKVLGECLLRGVRTKDRVLVTSGRLSSEILVKAARARVPIMVSKSAPTDLAVKLAEDFGIAIVGFARGSRMNVYSTDWRVKI